MYDSEWNSSLPKEIFLRIFINAFIPKIILSTIKILVTQRHSRSLNDLLLCISLYIVCNCEAFWWSEFTADWPTSLWPMSPVLLTSLLWRLCVLRTILYHLFLPWGFCWLLLTLLSVPAGFPTLLNANLLFMLVQFLLFSSQHWDFSPLLSIF